MVKMVSKTRLSGLFFLLLGLASFAVPAAIDTYQFKDPKTQVRFQKLTNELRCPKCQNQNLADSNAEIAKDLRTKIYLMLEENKTDEAIVSYMLERYGDFVLYQPRLSKQTFLLWYAPVLLILLGLSLIGLVVWLRKKSAQNQTEANQLTIEQQQTLAQLLKSESE